MCATKKLDSEATSELKFCMLSVQSTGINRIVNLTCGTVEVVVEEDVVVAGIVEVVGVVVEVVVLSVVDVVVVVASGGTQHWLTHIQSEP
jgi:hypothetical protein